jgi:hypothetical protein
LRIGAQHWVGIIGYNHFVYRLVFYAPWLKKLNSYIYSEVFFFDTLQDLASSKPYTALTKREVTSFIEQYKALGESICSDPNMRFKFKRSNANLDAGLAWCIAIDRARKNGFYPCVVLPADKYEAAMSVLQLADEMDDKKKVEQYRWDHRCTVL